MHISFGVIAVTWAILMFETESSGVTSTAVAKSAVECTMVRVEEVELQEGWPESS